MKLIGYGAAFALVISAAVSAHQATPSLGNDDKDVTITGCVVKGDGGYVLANVTDAPGLMAEPTSGSVAATTSAAISSHMLYWLHDDKDLDEHAGQRVQVTGRLKDDVDKGEIEVEHKGDIAEIEFKAEGKKIKVKVPETPVATSGMTGKEKDFDVLVKRIDVKSIRMISSTCS